AGADEGDGEPGEDAVRDTAVSPPGPCPRTRRRRCRRTHPARLPDGYRLYVNPSSTAGAVLETGPLAEMMALIRGSRPRQQPSRETGSEPGTA
ncbi:hypothetical protein ACWDRN_39160, partial [Streptomyces tendae]